MISIIIASVNAKHRYAISANIARTIGVPYEIIVTENSNGTKGICEIYNSGIKQAKYDILCFMHEDIEILTHNWGTSLISLFDDPEIGLIGVAGASYLPMSPSTGGGIASNAMHINIVQSFKFKKKETVFDHVNPNNEALSEVTYVDGVFLCSTKKVTKEFLFDPVVCPGFHGYDVDFSLAVGTKYKVAVTYDLLIHHFSEGNFNKGWLLDTINVFNKWNKRLPVNIKKISPEDSFKAEKRAFKHFVEQLIAFNLSLDIALKVLWKQSVFIRYNLKLLLSLTVFTLKQKLQQNRIQSL